MQEQLYLLVTFGDLALIVFPALQGLPERKQVLRLPGTAKCFDDLFRLFVPNRRVAQLQQFCRITLSVQNGMHYGKAAGSHQ